MSYNARYFLAIKAFIKSYLFYSINDEINFLNDMPDSCTIE